jgi:hypothetical protein
MLSHQSVQLELENNRGTHAFAIDDMSRFKVDDLDCSVVSDDRLIGATAEAQRRHAPRTLDPERDCGA